MNKNLRENSQSKGVDAWTIATLGSFYVEYRSEFLAHASRIMRDSARAEEVVQEALIRVLLAAPELSNAQHALSYMHRTIENLCIDIFRIEGRRPKLIALDEVTSSVERLWQVDGDLSELIVASEDAAIVRQALSLLSPAERAALVMWEIEGRRTEEIAKELGVKESSVRHTVSRARNSFKRILSEIIFDEDRGLTALDMLSTTYRKSMNIAKKSSKIALSLLLLMVAFMGFKSTPFASQNLDVVIGEFESSDLGKDNFNKSDLISSAAGTNPTSTNPLLPKTRKFHSSQQNSKIQTPGLDVNGLPIGFTVSDSTGQLGSAYFMERDSLQSDSARLTRQIIKTESGAANVFISQSLATGEDGLKYEPFLSFGRDGRWIPLSIKVISTEIKRQRSGDYLLTVSIQVESALESPIEIVATAGGRDLQAPPRQVVTRLLLDPSMTRVIAQSIYVDDDGVTA